MHARRTARDAFLPNVADDAFFSPRRGDIVFRTLRGAREFADRLNKRPGAKKTVPGSELAAMSLLHELLHAVIQRYRALHPDSFARLTAAAAEAMGDSAHAVVVDFVAGFPPPAVYRALRGEGDLRINSPARYVERLGYDLRTEIDEEMLLLWVTSQNKAYEPIADVVGDAALGPRYRAFIGTARKFFENEPPFGPNGETLMELLLEPGSRDSIFEQLDYVDDEWVEPLGLGDHPAVAQRAKVEELRSDEGRWFQHRGPGPGEPLLESMRFGQREKEEKAQFSPDLNWMPQVVLIAKSVYVWLDQLGKRYERSITRLDQIPDEELDKLRTQGITGLWLIGLFERSHASKQVKQMRGDTQAIASAYSLFSYEISGELGGVPAWKNLRDRAWSRGIRLAADMVPNHVGIDGQWVMNHPEWFLQAKQPPYPNYRYGGPDLSSDPRAGVYLENGYWDMSDAAVTFMRVDRATGEQRFIYHGNDGTSMPWNDTAQLDYSKAEVRKAVIDTILHVASMFPIIRFDAAMTLAKRHIQRLWFPLPKHGAGAIPSRGDYEMTDEEFDALIPIEFWREVVDTVAQRAPDTLLLAEAFWMMEGYFVRTLGMHRVYNSAFMNMLKREENAKYRETITNVLDFDPEILKRFVNFMNNPDEDTAIAQFGEGDKYFGTCAMMATLPGLPMIGHGQIEGFREKYGMEYARAKFQEIPNGHVVYRHEQEIFPILHRRWMFSGVENFALYTLHNGFGFDEDVFAYSNGAGTSRALFLFNNRDKHTAGRIHRSTHRGTLGDELSIDIANGDWVVIRDIPHKLEYLRPAQEILDEGLTWALGPYEYHVLTDFRSVHTSLELAYDRLALELNGAGVADIDFAARELYLRPLHAPLREACSKGHTQYLAAQLDAADATAGRASIEEKLGHFADGLEWMLSRRSGRDVTLERAEVLKRAGDRFAALHRFSKERVSSPDLEMIPTSERAATVLHVDMLLASIHLEGAIELLAQSDRSVAIAMYLPAPTTPLRPDPSTPKAVSSRILAAASSRAAIAAESSRTAVSDAALPEAPPSLVTSAVTPISDPTLPAAPASDVSLPPVSDPVFVPPSIAEDETLTARVSAPPASVESLAEAAPLNVVIKPLDVEIPAPPNVLPPVPFSQAETLPELPAPDDGSDPNLPVAAISAPEVDEEPAPKPVEPKPEPKKNETPSSPAALAAPVPPSSTTREALLMEWQLAVPIVAGFTPMLGDEEAKRRAAIVILGATLPSAPLAAALRLALGTRRGRQFMNVHESSGTFWLNQERFEELAHFIGEREGAMATIEAADMNKAIEEVIELAKREGYKAQEIAGALEALAPPIATY
jgi:glycosidase